jgi:hypothetical protein
MVENRMKETTNTQNNVANRLTFFRIFRDVVFVGLFSFLVLLAPFFLGKYVGHGWGLLAALAGIAGWFYVRKKMAATGSAFDAAHLVDFSDLPSVRSHC